MSLTCNFALLFFSRILNIFCVVFLSDSANKKPTALFDPFMKSKLLKKISQDEFFAQNAQFVYIYQDVQTDFMDSLTKFSKSKNAKTVNKFDLNNNIVILKRIDDRRINYDWLDNLNSQPTTTINVEPDIMIQQIEQIKSTIKHLMNGNKRLQYQMNIPNFYSEYSQVII